MTTPLATHVESGEQHKMSDEQEQLLAFCRRAYKSGSSDANYIGGQLLYPCVQREHDRVALVTSDSHPEVLVVASFRPNGQPVRFEDRRTSEIFAHIV